MDKTFEQLTIGVDSGLIHFESLEQTQNAIDQMANGAQHCIQLFSIDLDKRLYGRQSFLDGIIRSCRSNRNFRMQILTKQTNPRAFDGHLLIKLQRRLTTYLSIRALALDFEDYDHEYMVFDQLALVERDPQAPAQARGDFFSASRGPAISREFQSMWDLSSPHQETKRLNL